MWCLSLILIIFVHSIIAINWDEFKLSYNKTYPNVAEMNKRKQIFEDNLAKIAEHNKRYELSLVTYLMGVNQFTDLTPEEFLEAINAHGYNKERRPFFERNLIHKNESNKDLPDSFDWRDRNAITSVKNQGNCGSCWAFSAIGAVEAHNFIMNGELYNLSAQQLIDCAGSVYLNEGCNGGYPDTALVYIMDYGVTTEENYPYEGATTSECNYKKENAIVTFPHVGSVLSGSEKSLQNAIATIGPIIVGVNTVTDFQLYSSGIFYSDKCSNKYDDLNHAMVVVGYGSISSATDYWIVKNSWGSTWGENGYIRTSRNKDNNCGIASDMCYPIFKI